MDVVFTEIHEQFLRVFSQPFLFYLILLCVFFFSTRPPRSFSQYYRLFCKSAVFFQLFFWHFSPDHGAPRSFCLLRSTSLIDLSRFDVASVGLSWRDGTPTTTTPISSSTQSRSWASWWGFLVRLFFTKLHKTSSFTLPSVFRYPNFPSSTDFGSSGSIGIDLETAVRWFLFPVKSFCSHGMASLFLLPVHSFSIFWGVFSSDQKSRHKVIDMLD